MTSPLRLIPSSPHPTLTHPHASAPSAPGLPDTLRATSSTTYTNTPNPTSISTSTSTGLPQSQSLSSTHPLEPRLSAWPTTQQTLKHALLRHQFGIAAPTIRAMELAIVDAGEGGRPSCLGRGAGVHGDVLRGWDWSVEGWEDVFVGDEMRSLPDFHAEMEMRLGMNW